MLKPQVYNQDDKTADKLIKWGEAKFGAGIFDGVKSDDWKFIVLMNNSSTLVSPNASEISQKTVSSDNHLSASEKAFILEPIICKTQEELDKKVSELFFSIQGKKVIGQEKPEKHEISTTVFARDAAVVASVLVLSEGLCECCRNKAPFLKENGQPFLEVHHVKHLANGGKDTTTNAVAVCPNCHRELHHGINKNSLIQLLYSKVARLIEE